MEESSLTAITSSSIEPASLGTFSNQLDTNMQERRDDFSRSARAWRRPLDSIVFEENIMQIHGLGQVHGPQPINSPHQNKAPQPSSPSNTNPSGVDQLDISPEADFVSRVRDIPEIREDLVAKIRDQIESGTYETDEKIDIALENLLDEIGD